MIADVNQYYKANVGLVHQVSRKGWARLQKAGVAMDYDDVFQEMSCVFLKCCEGFDDEKGFKFSTYFYMGAYNRLNKWAQDLIVERLEHGVVSIEEMNHGAEDELSLEDVIMKDYNTPDRTYAATQFVAYLNRKLSPVAKLIVDWSIEPPNELMAEIEKIHANAEYGRSLGMNTRCFTQLNPKIVGTFIVMVSDVTEAQIRQALRELEDFKAYGSRMFF